MDQLSTWTVGKIERAYNPEHDIPSPPEVSWVEYELLQIIKRQDSRIEELERQVKNLDAWSNSR